MSDFKEFQGKTLDSTIAEACAYYDLPREKLEIEIVEDAKTGIFGLVGARKARIRARRAQLPDMLNGGRGKNRQGQNKQAGKQADSAPPPVNTGADANTADADTDAAMESQDIPAPLLSSRADAPQNLPAPLPDQAASKVAPRQAPKQPPKQPLDLSTEQDSDDEDDINGNRQPAPAAQRNQTNQRNQPGQASRGIDSSRQRPRDDDNQARAPQNGRRKNENTNPESRRGPAPVADAHDGDTQDIATMPRVSLTALDQDKLLTVTKTMILALVSPLLDEEEPSLEIRVSDDRLHVQIQSEATGLLIGRDGQNLAAVQYLAARMISRAMEAQVRIQVDAGDYHSRQDMRLQELAATLADKVRATGRPQSTRPLSAYQRRVIHLALQDDPDVQTRSSGEGPLKRVLVQRRKDQN